MAEKQKHTKPFSMENFRMPFCVENSYGRADLLDSTGLDLFAPHYLLHEVGSKCTVW